MERVLGEKRRMRICFVSDQTFPPVGGEGVSTQNFSLGLRKKQATVIILTSRAKPPFFMVEGIKIYRFFSISLPREKGYFAFASSGKISSLLKRERIEIVQINLPTYLGWQALRGARKIGIPVVLGFHVQVGNLLPPHFPPFLIEKAIENWFSYFYNRGDLIVVPSHFACRIARNYTHRPIQVVSNGVDLDWFTARKASLEDRMKFRESYELGRLLFLLYVGRLSDEKNPGYLIEIMGLLKKRSEAKLLMVGEGVLEDELREKIAKYGLKKRVILPGYLRGKDLLYAYLEADIFILSSFYELQSIATLEAMATRNAILVGKSRENAAQELVREGINGYTFSLDDPQDASDKIENILGNEKLKRSMQEESYRMVQSHSLKRSVSRLEKIYKSLIGGAGIEKTSRFVDS
jgi:glycosyltransferase involved in cell wall biosynthesis